MTMKVVRFNCAGLDVHSKLIVATVGITDAATMITEYHQKEFGTLNPDLNELARWLLSYECKEVCMESTGKYWIPPFNVLESYGITTTLAHPKYTRAIKGKKTDKKDSKWICDLFKHDLVKGSFIPPKEIREMRELSRYYIKLIAMRSSESLRLQNCMTISNLQVHQIFSDPLGKSAQRVLKEVINNENPNEEEIQKLIHKRCKKKGQVMDAITGSKIEPDSRFKMKTALEHIDELGKHIDACFLELLTRASKLPNEFIHITSIPGISETSAILIISEIGVNMNMWESGRELACWAGLTPGNNESAYKKKSVRITKAGQYLKPILVQCALAAVNSNSNLYFRIKYNRIKKRRGHKKAIIAIARMILISIYHMIATGETFNPTDYEELLNPKPKKTNSITIESALQFLKDSGFDISTFQRSTAGGTDSIQPAT